MKIISYIKLFIHTFGSIIYYQLFSVELIKHYIRKNERKSVKKKTSEMCGAEYGDISSFKQLNFKSIKNGVKIFRRFMFF